MAVLICIYAHVLLSDNNLSEQTWNVISGSTIFLAFMSRGRQFYTNYKNDSTGQLSGRTLFINNFISGARVISVILETDNFMYQVQHLLCDATISALWLQFVWMNFFRQKKAKRASYKKKPTSETPQKNRKRSSSPSLKRSSTAPATTTTANDGGSRLRTGSSPTR